MIMLIFADKMLIKIFILYFINNNVTGRRTKLGKKLSLIIITFCLCLGLFTSTSNATTFTSADLTGTWYLYLTPVKSGTSTVIGGNYVKKYSYVYGAITTTTGAITAGTTMSFFNNSDGSSKVTVASGGTLAISTYGVITGTIKVTDPSSTAISVVIKNSKMDAGKTMFSGIFSISSTEYGMITGVKK
jgi:hypothetical protein